MLIVVVALATIGWADGWRTAVIVAFAAGAIRSSEVRFSAQAAVMLTIGCTLIALAGHGATRDERPASSVGDREMGGAAPHARSARTHR